MKGRSLALGGVLALACLLPFVLRSRQDEAAARVDVDSAVAEAFAMANARLPGAELTMIIAARLDFDGRVSRRDADLRVYFLSPARGGRARRGVVVSLTDGALVASDREDRSGPHVSLAGPPRCSFKQILRRVATAEPWLSSERVNLELAPLHGREGLWWQMTLFDDSFEGHKPPSRLFEASIPDDC